MNSPVRQIFCFMKASELESSPSLSLKQSTETSDISNEPSGTRLIERSPPFLKRDNRRLRTEGRNPNPEPEKEAVHSEQNALEIQDDSFVNFSVGHLNKQSFSILSVAKYARSIVRTEDFPDESCHIYSHSTWRHRRYRSKSRSTASFRRPKDEQQPVDNDKQNAFLAPVKRCFYY